jgi:hypothetical protein
MDTSTFRLNLDPNKPEGDRKSLGGGKADEWNDRLSNLTVSALPIAHSKNNECRVQSEVEQVVGGGAAVVVSVCSVALSRFRNSSPNRDAW